MERIDELYSSHLGAEGITVGEFADMLRISNSAARYKLEKLTKQGKMVKSICDTFVESSWSGPYANGYTRYMACYELVNGEYIEVEIPEFVSEQN